MRTVTRRGPRYCYRHEGALHVSSPLRIGKTDWRLVVHRGSYGVCVDYQWRRYDDDPWCSAESWPSYNGNDGMFAGLPKTLRTLWEREQASIAQAKGVASAH